MAGLGSPMPTGYEPSHKSNPQGTLGTKAHPQVQVQEHGHSLLQVLLPSQAHRLHLTLHRYMQSLTQSVENWQHATA